MTKVEYLLSCLAEECAEVAQRAHKAQRFGIQEIQPGQTLTNATRLVDEINDLHGAIEALRMYCPSIPPDGQRDAINAKVDKILNYMRYSQELGIVDADG